MEEKHSPSPQRMSLAPNRAKRARWLCIPGKIDRGANDTPPWASLRLAASFVSVGWERFTGDRPDDTSAVPDMLSVRWGNDILAKARERSSTRLLLAGEGEDTADIKPKEGGVTGGGARDEEACLGGEAHGGASHTQMEVEKSVAVEDCATPARRDELASVRAFVVANHAENLKFLHRFKKTQHGRTKAALEIFERSRGDMVHLDEAMDCAMRTVSSDFRADADARLRAASIAMGAAFVKWGKARCPTAGEEAMRMKILLGSIVSCFWAPWASPVSAGTRGGKKNLECLLDIVFCASLLLPWEPFLSSLGKDMMPVLGLLCASEPGFCTIYGHVASRAMDAILDDESVVDLELLASSMNVSIDGFNNRGDILRFLLDSRERHASIAAVLARYMIEDRRALLDLYDRAGGTARRCLRDWSTAEPLRRWYGVTTNTAGRVVGLNLACFSLEGGLPFSLINLNALTHLDLSGNTLTAIPWLSFRGQVSLTHLNLSRNKLSGRLPKILGEMRSLVHLDLSGNRLSGGVPQSWSNLTSLMYVDLSGNEVSGMTWSSSTGKVPFTHLNLSGNNLSGKLPEILGEMRFLVHLDLSGNQLSGPLPERLGELTSLTHLDVSGNKLSVGTSGPLGSMTSLTHLGLARAGLSGSMPEWLGGLTRLTHLDLSGNELSGPPPTWEKTLMSVTHLDLAGNNLSGGIETLLRNMTSLIHLVLARVGLSGPIPEWLKRLRCLTHLDLSENELTGDIPEWLRGLPLLTHLDLSGNMMTGLAAEWLKEPRPGRHLDLSGNRPSGPTRKRLREPRSLTHLDLSGNKMAGEIPGIVRFMASLTHLDLAGIGVSGSVPQWLEELKCLTYLDLSENSLSGALPEWLGEPKVLRHMDLSGNDLSGDLPWGLGELTSLMYLDLSGNKLSESRPWRLEQLTSLTHLDLSGNEFPGETLGPLRKMTSLAHLGLAGIGLSGAIPGWLGELKNLRHLDLSGNKLSGPVLPSLGDLKAMSHMDLSGNELSGLVPPSLWYLMAWTHPRYPGKKRPGGTRRRESVEAIRTFMTATYPLLSSAGSPSSLAAAEGSDVETPPAQEFPSSASPWKVVPSMEPSSAAATTAAATGIGLRESLGRLLSRSDRSARPPVAPDDGMMNSMVTSVGSRNSRRISSSS